MWREKGLTLIDRQARIGGYEQIMVDYIWLYIRGHKIAEIVKISVQIHTNTHKKRKGVKGKEQRRYIERQIEKNERKRYIG